MRPSTHALLFRCIVGVFAVTLLMGARSGCMRSARGDIFTDVTMVEILPAAPAAGDDLVAAVHERYRDEDGVVHATWEWFVVDDAGVPVAQAGLDGRRPHVGGEPVAGSSCTGRCGSPWTSRGRTCRAPWA